MSTVSVNNTFYDHLGAAWWTATDHMITFLRYESQLKVDYCLRHLPPPQEAGWIAEFGAGAGLVSIPLAQAGYRVIAVDLAAEALAQLHHQAEQRGVSDRIQTVVGDITVPVDLPEKVSAILALDVLEHVAEPAAVVAQAARHLPPGGTFLYHTLNRTVKCWLLYLQLAPRLIRHSPKDVHRWRYNIRPDELHPWLSANHLTLIEERGTYSPLWQPAMWELLTTRAVTTPFRFEYSRDKSCGYLGCAIKQESDAASSGLE